MATIDKGSFIDMLKGAPSRKPTAKKKVRYFYLSLSEYIAQYVVHYYFLPY